MELRDWAWRILSADTLSEKLFFPKILTDHEPGRPFFWKEPVRPKGMQFCRHTRKDKLPKLHDQGDPDKRAICLHRFAGHELLAVEIMAYALLAFPKAPKHFRRGVANTLREEQYHVRLYSERMRELGLCFGDLPLYKHFWSYIPFLRTPEQYISVMSLTFEMANLDFAPLYRDSFAKFGDEKSAQLMQKILTDEISHVSFGFNWLKKIKKPELSIWEAWVKALPCPLTIKRACGPIFIKEYREKAGIPKDWIEMLTYSV